MFIQVKLLNGFKEPLIYKIPQEWKLDNLVGSLVKVPLQKRTEIGIIRRLLPETPTTFTIKYAYQLESIPEDKHYAEFLDHLSNYYSTDPLFFYKRLQSFLTEKEFSLENLQDEKYNNNSFKLTEEQQKIVDQISPSIINSTYFPSIIHGVTGSGKTEIYKNLILTSYQQNKSTILLLPEVSLAVQFTNLLKQQLRNINIQGFHSAIGVQDKRSLWMKLINKEPLLIIGVHLPILLPISNLGLIIIDEEHDVGYQEKKHPKINSKEAAIMRAQIAKIPVILGSATPSITTLYNVKKRNWHFFQLKTRFSGAFPKITCVNLTKVKNKRSFWISDTLINAISEKLEKKEQTIIFLNRRGYSFFIQCKSCGLIPTCTSCSVSLTLHQDGNLKCHYCGFNQPEIKKCTSCNCDSLLKQGIGTQQIVSILEKLFPNAKIDRADLDATVNKKKWQNTLKNFSEKKIDILVGTQTITKGYDFPGVTLVGILWADINLSFPIYNAAETTLQQLIQVAGRAGRHTQDSQVIVQYVMEHPIFKYLSEKDYYQFFNNEIKLRTEVLYPPIIRLAEIELKFEQEEIVELEARTLAYNISRYIIANNLKIEILGPAQPPVHKIKNVFSRKIYLKSANFYSLLNAFKDIKLQDYQSSIFFNPNPQS